MNDDVNRRTVFPVRNICRGNPGKWVYDDRDPLQDDTHALMPWKEYERLTDELADALKNESHYAKEIIEKDKRIEELENTKAVVEYMNAKGAFITTEQIDKAWEYAQLLDARGTAWAVPLLLKLNIPACEECGGGVSKAWDNGCPSCHGHGWKKT